MWEESELLKQVPGRVLYHIRVGSSSGKARISGRFPTGIAWDGTLSFLKEGDSVVAWGRVCVSFSLNFKGQEDSRDSLASDLTPNAGILFTFNPDEGRPASALSCPMVSTLLQGLFWERCAGSCTVHLGCASQERRTGWSSMRSGRCLESACCECVCHCLFGRAGCWDHQSSGCSRFSNPSLGVFLSWSPPFFNGLARKIGKREAT